MSDLILPSVVAAVAHTRLREIGIALRNKLTAANFDVRHADLSSASTLPVRKSRVEQDILALVEEGQKLLAGFAPAPVPSGVDIEGVGRFAILGTTGFEWPDYASHFVLDKTGRGRAMRTGSADPDFSSVAVPTTHFAIRVGQLGRGLTTDDQERAEIGAFAAGLLTRVAHDVVIGPLGRGVRGDLNLNKHSRTPIPGMSGAADQALDALLGGQRGAGVWQSWWPDEVDISPALYDGYLSAVNEVYGFVDGDTPPGFPEFLADFDGLPELNLERLRAGVSFLGQDVTRGSWNFGTWYATFLPAILSVPLSLLIGRYASPASGFFEATPNPSALGGLQLYALGAGISAITPFALSMHAWSEVLEHSDVFISSLVVGIARLVTTIATVSFAAGDVGVGAAISGALLAGTDLYTLIAGFVNLGEGKTPEASVHFINSMPFVFGLLSIGGGAIFEAIAQDTEGDFWFPWAVITALMGAIGILPAALLSGSNGIAGLFDPEVDPSLPLISSIDALSSSRVRTRAATFDDSTLAPTGASPEASGAGRHSQMRYPTDGGAVLKLWWEGDGDLTIEHDANRVVLRVDGAEHEVVLRADQASAAVLGELLVATLSDVRVAVVNAATEPQLPYPIALKDPGDDQPSHTEHDATSSQPQPVGTSEDDAYVLRSAPRAELATRTGLSATANDAAAPIEIAPSGRDLAQSGVGLAGELAALLVAGAAPSFGAVDANGSSLPALADSSIGPVYQVLRNWNLDERRLNEWRAIVSGGAKVEKSAPVEHDESMRPLEARTAAYASAAPDGDDLLNDMGWIPTWRAWLRMATDPTSDPTQASAERYTPIVARRDGRNEAPTNLELSTAMRFLFDLR